MKKLSVLMRLDRYELLGINRRLHDPAQRLGGKWLLALIVLAAIAAVGVAFAYCMGVAYALSAIGALAVFPVMLVSVSALVALITTIVKAPDALFGTRDLDMLLSLPIPTRTVATARVLKIYSMNLLFTLLILVPGGVAYGILAAPAPAFYISYALCALAAPMLPAVVASFLGALVALAGASIKRLRYAGLFLMFVALIGVVVGSSYLSSTAANAEMFIDFAKGFSDLFARIYPLAGLYEKAVLGGDAVALLAYVGLSLLAILLAGRCLGASSCA